MLRNTKTKLFLSLLLIITLIAPFSFAENEIDTEPTTDTTQNFNETDEDIAPINETDDETVDEQYNAQSGANQDIHEGDLYLTGNDVTMDKLVNGNVYIFGNNVTVTGQIAGNLFVGANKLEFKDAYIESSAYICANSVNFGAVASDLYVCCNTLEIPTNYGVYRDLKSYSNSATLLGIIGRNADCEATTLSLSKDDAKATIYGDFNYGSISEIEIPEGSVEGETKYSKITRNDNQNNISDYIYEALCAIIFTLVIYGLALLFTKGSIEKCTKITAKKFLPAFGIGLLTLILVPIASIILMITVVGLPLSFAILVFYGLLISLATSVFSIAIANILCDKFKLSNNWLKVLGIAIVSLLVYIIGIIPYVSILKILIVILGFGTLVMNMFFKNMKFEKEN